MSDQSGDLTVLLRRWSEGDPSALEQITPFVYQTLRALAESYMRRERPDHTLQPTALVHEAYLRLLGQHQDFESRNQFYGVAAHLMRIILVDHARAHQAVKRGRGAVRIPLDEMDVAAEERGVDVVALDEAVERLAAFDARKARAIDLRYFAGLGVEETAQALDVSVATVRRELRFAENWLYREITKQNR